MDVALTTFTLVAAVPAQAYCRSCEETGAGDGHRGAAISRA